MQGVHREQVLVVPHFVAMRRSILEKLSIDYILARKTPEEIFSRYWNIPLHEITEAIVTGKPMYAPYRDDNTPSLGFYENDGKLYARDWAGYFWGDCFDAVAFTVGRDTNGLEFGKVLEQIAKDFGLHKYATENTKGYRHHITRTYTKKQRLKFDVIDREWNINDKAFWKDRFYIGVDILQAYQVFPVDELWINGLIRYTYNPRNPAYAYYFGRDKDDIIKWKIYFPYADKSKKQRKFMQNCSVLEGELHLRKAKLGVITKSYKDVMAVTNVAINEHLSLLAVGPPSESTILGDGHMVTLRKYSDTWYTLSDYDKTGVQFAGKMRRKHGTIPLFFTRGRFGKPDFGAKDFTDNIELWGYDNIAKLVKYICEQGHEDLLNYLKR